MIPSARLTLDATLTGTPGDPDAFYSDDILLVALDEIGVTGRGIAALMNRLGKLTRPGNRAWTEYSVRYALRRFTRANPGVGVEVEPTDDSAAPAGFSPANGA